MPRNRRPLAVLAVVCAASFLTMLATSAINAALPTLIGDLSASTNDLQWIVNGYNLAFASFVLAFGSLSDRYGRKGALLLGLTVFGGAAAAGSQAVSAEQLIAAQAVMGLGAALIFPTTLSIISNTFTERATRAKAIAVWGAVTGLGAGLGPVVGGGLLKGFWWGAILVCLALLAAGVAITVLAVVTTSRDPATPRLDLLGLTLSVLGVGALVYTVIEAPERGWLDPITCTGYGVSGECLFLLVVWELRCREPMLDVRLFRNPRFSAASMAIACAYFALFGFVFIGTQYMQFVKGYSPLSAGTRLLPIAAAIGVGSIVGTLLAVRIGNKIVVTTGMALLTADFLWLAGIDSATSYGELVATMVALGLGLGFTSAPATEAIMGVVSKEKAGIGSAMNDATRELGGTLGVAVVGSVFVSIYADQLTNSSGATALPPGARDVASESIGAAQAIAAGLPDAASAGALLDSATTAFLDGFGAGCLAAAGVTALGALIVALFLPAKPASDLDATSDIADVDLAPRSEPARAVLAGCPRCTVRPAVARLHP